MLACSFTAKAQADYSNVDIFGGYSYVRFNFAAAGFNANGGSDEVTYNFNSAIGLAGDFGGYHVGSRNGSGTVFTYLFGPKFTYREGNWSPFIHTLFGGAWLGASVPEVCVVPAVGPQGTACTVSSTSFNAFSMALGGGTDYRVSDHVSIRLFDIDYLMTRFNAASVGGTNNTQSNIRVSTGVVFHF
jgi:hypothetical protein